MLDAQYRGNLTEEAWSASPEVLKRLLTYVRFPTASDPASAASPSTEAQLAFAELLAGDFEAAGLERVAVTGEGVLMAELPATPGFENRPALGLVAHLDTSPEAPEGPVEWRVIDYAGGDIVLNEEGPVVLTLERFPNVGKYAGEKLVVTDGKTLLGADDKAGVAVLVEAARWFAEHPEIPHAKLCFAVTPDEEIGRGTENFDIAAFGADYAYTIDGGEVGGFETATFNAAVVKVRFKGLNVHPGTAKNRMVNAIRIALDFLSRFPEDEVPEKTELYEGFFHPIDVKGTVEGAEATILIRDHDAERFRERCEYVRSVAADANRAWDGRIEVEIREQYRNLKEYLDRTPKVAELAREALRRCGLEPVELPVRGGTDGCRLSEQGLPTPNLFTGGMNYHGVYECIPVASLEKSLEVVKTLCALSAEIESIR